MKYNNFEISKQSISPGTALPTRSKTIKVGIRTWDSLKGLKKENETFDDVIKYLLNERTKEIGDENIKAIKYQRKSIFFVWGGPFENQLGFEFEYNDVKNNKTDFIFDLKIKKVFVGKKILNPSEFFGVDSTHKHFSRLFLLIYLQSIALALKKEFKIMFPYSGLEQMYESIAVWRQLYYEYSLSHESFKNDIEEPLRLSVDEKVSEHWRNKISNSPSAKYVRKEQ